MHVRRWLFSLLTLTVVLSCGTPTPAQKAKDPKKDDKKTDKPKVEKPAPPPPPVVLRVRSIEGLLADVRVLARLAGKDEAGKQVEATVRAVLGGKGFGGLDPKRPIGLCSQFTEETTVLLLPLADEKVFLAMLESLNIKAEKSDDGIHTVNLDVAPIPIHFRFSGKYIHLTGHKEGLDLAKLYDAERILSNAAPGIFSIDLRLDQIAPAARQELLDKLQANLAAEEQKKDDEDEARYRGRVAGARAMTRLLADAVKEGGRISARLDLNDTSSELTFETALAGLKGSNLEKRIADLAKSKSLFASLGGDAASMNFLLHFQVGEEIIRAFLETYDEGVTKDLDQEEDKARRDAAEKLFKAIKPTIEAGDADIGFSLTGTGPYTFVGGARLKNGLAVEKAFRDVVKTLPDRSRAKIKLDVETVESIQVHRVDVQKDLDDNAKQLLGERPMYLAFRPDGVFLAGGPDGLTHLKDALESSPRPAPLFQMDLSLARLVRLLTADNPAARAAADKAFAKGANRDGGDRVSFRVEGGAALTMRVAIKPSALNFLFLFGEATRPKEEPVEEKKDEPKEEGK